MTKNDDKESGLYYVFDIETTGNDIGYNFPIQFCMTEFNLDDAAHKRVVESLYINPVEPILPIGISIHGLSESILKKNGSVNANVGIKRIHECMNKYKDEWVLGYNHSTFDLPVLNKAFAAYKLKEITLSKSLDVFSMAKKLIDIADIGAYKLDSVFIWLFMNNNLDTAIDSLFKLRSKHSADTDIVLTNLIALRLMKRFVLADFEEAVKVISIPTKITIFPFGKYKGLPIEEVVTNDASYIQWLLKSKAEMTDKYPDLMFTICEIMNNLDKHA